jgi:hypothetical protein
MTLIAPASIVTAVCSWSTAGNDGARQNPTAKDRVYVDSTSIDFGVSFHARLKVEESAHT